MMQRMDRPKRTKGAILAILFTVVVGILACDKIAPDTSLPALPTPLSAPEFRAVELATHGLLTDVYGDHAVGTHDDGELWLLNIRTGEARQLTDDSHYKWGAVLTSTHVRVDHEG